MARLFYLQIIQHDVYQTLSDKNRIQVQSIPPTRGLVFDRDGELIADNIPSYRLTITKERVEDLDQTIKELREILEISDDQVASFKRRLTPQAAALRIRPGFVPNDAGRDCPRQCESLSLVGC